MRNTGATASQLSRHLFAATGTRVSRVTASKRLHERGLFARRPAVCVPLMSTNRRVHLAWCRQHRDWTVKPLVRMSSRLVGVRGREVGGPWLPPGFSSLNWGGTEQNPTVTCMVLKAKANDRRKNSNP
ncbi:HTH_Tnp_Tc3_2 domain-containing protein [Trichonephila clavipes]|nr:HTH_Tnp_Tc3_2 domain-containing protein [Trichonephila clavipes]